MIAILPSKGGVPIRLTEERWRHILEEHNELADLRQELLQAVAEPEASLKERPENFWRCGSWRMANG